MEDEFIKDWTEGILTIKELEKKYECPRTNLKTRARNLNIIRNKKEIDIDNIIIDYVNGKSIRKLSKEIRICPRRLKNILEENNVKLRNSSERATKCKVDENYFNILDNQNKFYILGLLYADGYNYEERYTITLSLKENDKYILEKISNILKSEREIKNILNKNYNKYYPRLMISNKKLSKRLAELGITKNKSLTLKFPSFILKDNEFKHFLRGYIDGDGCISCCQFANKRYSVSISICSTYDFLIEVQQRLINLFSINKTKISKAGEKAYVLSINQRYKVEEILDWIYKDADLYLCRKYQNYLNIKEFNLLNPIKRKIPERKDYNE